MVNKCQQINYRITYGQMNLINDTRFTLLHLPNWMRQYILSIMMSLPNLEAVTERLYNVPLEIYHMFLPFFGSVVAERFLNILTSQITIIGALANSIKDGDITATNENTVKLYENADEFAEFLANLNPFWSFTQWQSLIRQYLRMIIEIMVNIASGNYSQEITVYDRLERHTTIIADYTAYGIMQYFIPSEVPGARE